MSKECIIFSGPLCISLWVSYKRIYGIESLKNLFLAQCNASFLGVFQIKYSVHRKTPLTFILIKGISYHVTDSYSETNGPSPDTQNRSKFHFNIILLSTSFNLKQISLTRCSKLNVPLISFFFFKLCVRLISCVPVLSMHIWSKL